MNTGDYVIFKNSLGVLKIWSIEGIYLGGEKQVSLVRLRAENLKENDNGCVMVPPDFIEPYVYTKPRDLK